MRRRRDNRKLGQVTFTDFHKVKVIFVSEHANNTWKCTNMLSGFTVVVTVVEIRIILDPSYNCVSLQSQGSRNFRGAPKIRADLYMLISWKRYVVRKSPVQENTHDPSTIRYNAQIACRPKSNDGSGRTESVLKETGSVSLISKIFIHVSAIANATKVGQRHPKLLWV